MDSRRNTSSNSKKVTNMHPSMESLLSGSLINSTVSTNGQSSSKHVDDLEQYLIRDTKNELDHRHHAKLGEHAASLWKQNHMTDVVVYADGKTFQAHRAVLTCYSPFFKRNLMKPGTSQTITIRLSEVTSEAFKVLLNYMYTGELRLNCQNIGDVYKASKKLDMVETTEKCAKILTLEESSPENYLFKYVTARRRGIEEPYRNALKAILDRFEEIVLTTQYQFLSVDELCEIISSDSIGARSEVVIYLAALRWLNFNFCERKAFVVRVMRCVRFQLMELEEILCSFYPPLLPEITKEPEIRQQLLHGTCYAAARLGEVEGCFDQYGCSPRNYLVHADPLVLWDITHHDVSYHSPSEQHNAATKIQAHMKMYFTRKQYKDKLGIRNAAARRLQSFFRSVLIRKRLKKWTEVPKVPPGSMSPADTLSVDPCLHMILYHKKSRKTNKVIDANYFPLKKISKVVGSIQMPASPVLLLVGGINPSRPEDVFAAGQMMLRYEPKANEWKKCGMMPVPRHHHASAYLDGYLYVIGGCDPRLTFKRRMVATSTTFRFDICRKEWSRLSDMNHARVYHGIAILHDIIYAVGGKNEFGQMLSTVECYDSNNDRWCELDQSLCCPRMAMGVAAFKGMLWVAGGMVHPPNEKKAYLIRDVECYDPFSNKWMFTKSRLPSPRTLVKLAASDNFMYLIGGAVRTDTSDEMYLTSVPDVLHYDNGTNHWLSEGAIALGKHDVAVAVLDNTVYCVGGLSTKEMSALTEVVAHDTIMKTWVSRQALPIPVTGTTLVALPPK